MPNLRQLTRKTDTVTLPTEGPDDLVITYWPGAFSPTLLAEWQEIGEQPNIQQLTFLARTIHSLVAAWNLEDDDGPVPLTLAAVSDLGGDVLGTILNAIGRGMSDQDPTKASSSSAGSSTPAASTPSIPSGARSSQKPSDAAPTGTAS